MAVLLLFAAVLVAFAFAIDEHMFPLKGMQGLSITCDSEEKMNFVLQYQNEKDFDFMKISYLPEKNITVLVKANKVVDFKNQLNLNNIKYDVFIEDFQKVIDAESNAQKLALKRTRRSYNSQKLYSFDHFPRYVSIVNYMNLMSRLYDDVTLFSIGKSYESRFIYGVKISSGGYQKKPAILIDAGIHAREWIAPTTALFAISELVKKNNSYLYKNVDWYIIPTLNPDGYEFSHISEETRLWRKTRSPTINSWCKGVDANRNFDYMWNTVGTSSDPCSQTYPGSKAFSEKETQNLRDFVLSKQGSIKIYLSLHSFGKYLLYPWGYGDTLPGNELIHWRLGRVAAEVLSRKYGTQYTVGSAGRVLKPAAGGSDDWVKAVGGADISFTIELPGYSFVIPSTAIQPIGLETFEAFKVFGLYAARAYPVHKN